MLVSASIDVGPVRADRCLWPLVRSSQQHLAQMLTGGGSKQEMSLPSGHLTITNLSLWQSGRFHLLSDQVYQLLTSCLLHSPSSFLHPHLCWIELQFVLVVHLIQMACFNEPIPPKKGSLLFPKVPAKHFPFFKIMTCIVTIPIIDQLYGPVFFSSIKNIYFCIFSFSVQCSVCAFLVSMCSRYFIRVSQLLRFSFLVFSF